MKSEYSLTQGNIFITLVKFGLPLLGVNFLQSLYNIVDMMVVGHYVGSVGVAAISNASTICFIINSICIGVTTGGSVLISQNIGAQKEKEVNKIIDNLMIISIIISLLISVVGINTIKPLFQMINVPHVAMEVACNYMIIMYVGTIAVFGYNMVCAIMRGVGNSRSPFVYVLIATIINIILDFVLVGKLDMGVEGAAIATVIAQCISFLIALAEIRKCEFIRIRVPRGIDKKISPSILNLGLPTALQMVIVNVAFLIINGMLNIYGINVIAGYGIGLKINTFVGMFCWAIGQSVTIMVGQNIGANKNERVIETVKIACLINIVFTGILVFFVNVFATNIIALFDNSLEVIKEGTKYLRLCCSVNSIIYALMYTFDSFLIGIGKARLAMINAMLDAFVIRIPLAFFLNYFFQLEETGIYLGQAIAPIAPMIVGIIYFSKKSWVGKNLISA